MMRKKSLIETNPYLQNLDWFLTVSKNKLRNFGYLSPLTKFLALPIAL